MGRLNRRCDITDNFSLEEHLYDASAINDYQGCPKYMFYAWVKGYQVKEPNPALIFGHGFHAGLYEHYKGKSMEECVKEFSQLSSGITPDYRTAGWAEAIFKEYIERYKKENYEVLKSEITSKLPIGDRWYGFTIDQIVRDKYIYTLDHKTSSRIGASFFEGFRPHTQMDGYSWATWVMMGECLGVIINAISTAQRPKERFLRAISPRTMSEIERFPKTFIEWTDKIEKSVETGIWSMNTSHCSRWGKCRYWDLCVYGEEERIVEFKYKIDEKLPKKEPIDAAQDEDKEG